VRGGRGAPGRATGTVRVPPALPHRVCAVPLFQRRSLAPSQLAKRKAGGEEEEEEEEEEQRHPPAVSERPREAAGSARWGGRSLSSHGCLAGAVTGPSPGERGTGPGFGLFSPAGRELAPGRAVGGGTSSCAGGASWPWKKLLLGERPAVVFEGW